MKTSRAKLIHGGGTQAVRLPKGCRFSPNAEITVRREGRRVIIEPKDEWSAKFRACLGAWTEDIPRPKQRQIKDLRNPFA
jgi:virulence-associated protein VagC